MIFLILLESETVYFFFIITFEFKKKKLQLFGVCRNVCEFNIKEQSIYRVPPVNCFSTDQISNFEIDIKVIPIIRQDIFNLMFNIKQTFSAVKEASFSL